MEKEFNDLIENIKKCEICKDKFGFQPHPIFLGNINSKIVQISQAPSATVHETLKPFTDQSGKKLKYEWYMIDDDTFYNPNNFYIAALAHCYPGKDKNGNVKVYVRGKKGFYENYMKLSEFLDKANYLFVKSNGGVLIYMYEDVGIYVGRDASIYVDKINYEWYSVNFKSDRYEDKSKLMFDIYESFYKEKVYKENEKTKSR